MNFYQIPTPVKNEKYINELKQYYEEKYCINHICLIDVYQIR